MWTIVLLLFIICLVWDYIDEGGQFVAFSRFVEIANSFREPTPRKAKIGKNAMVLEYKYGSKLYAMIIPQPQKPLKWISVGAFIDGKWVDATPDVNYIAGPFRDFGGIGLKPEHINPDFNMLGFVFSETEIVHVCKGEIILSKLKEKYN
jgi:hypothetical protein